MLANTKKLVVDFWETGDISMLPAILLSIQEEDNIYDLVSFRNCLKKLRNVAAHEPQSLIDGFTKYKSGGYDKIIIETKNFEKVTFNVTAFLVWMYDIYLQTGEHTYLALGKGIAAYLLGKNALKVNLDVDVDFHGETNILKQFVYFQQVNYKTRNRLKTVNFEDDYVAGVLEKYPKAFWKLAIPDYNELVLSGVESINKCSNTYYRFIVEISRVREASN